MRRLTKGLLVLLLLAATACAQETVVEWAPDATAKIQAALDKALISPDPITVDIPFVGKKWVISRTLRIHSNTTLILRPYVRLVAKRNAFTGVGDCMIVMPEVANVAIRGYGATLRGWGRELTDVCRVPHSQWRHLISVRSSTAVTIEGVGLENCGGDAIYIASTLGESVPSRLVQIRDVTCLDNYRAGIGVKNVVGLIIENCDLLRTAGHNPAAGIKIEPNGPKAQLVGIHISNCRAELNNGAGYVVWLNRLDKTSTPVSIEFVNCGARGNLRPTPIVLAPNGLGAGSKIDFRNCVFLDSEKRDSDVATFTDCEWGSQVVQVTR